MNPENEQTVEQFLKTTSEFCKANNRRIGDYCSLYEWVLRNGAQMDCTHRDFGFPRMTQKECFRNATIMAMDQQGVLIYCEGYASAGIIPMMHAWCINKNGNVIDPTWMDRGTDYFGVAIRTSYLSRCMRRQSHYGLLDNPHDKFPLLRHSPTQWKHPINDKLIQLRTENKLL